MPSQLKPLLAPITILIFSLLISPAVIAHVTVNPKQANIATYQNFTVSVPTEKEIPTTKVRLVIPPEVSSVRPNVKPGWQITLTKDLADETKINEIIWENGSIPADQRDEFVFSAKLPAKAGNIIWKAYQTYQDGSTVSWDADPNQTGENDDDSDSGPYSQTKIIDDLNTNNAVQQTVITQTSQSVKAGIIISLILSVLAIVISIYYSQKHYSKSK